MGVWRFRDDGLGFNVLALRPCKVKVSNFRQKGSTDKVVVDDRGRKVSKVTEVREVRSEILRHRR